MKMSNLMGWVACALFSFGALAEAKYEFNHGPYIQELCPEGVTVLFTTNQKGISWVEVKEKSAGETAEGRKVYATVDGLRQANNTFNSIRLSDLKPGTEYQYRMGSKEIVKFEPYKVTFGEEIVSPWKDVKTFDPKQKKCSILAMSDIHDNTPLMENLMKLGNYETCDAFFLVGDIMSYCSKEGQPFTSFIDKCSEMFASAKPFVLVRGNHETRGHLARDFSGYIPHQNERIYGVQNIGDTCVVFLDCGEDKPDTHPVYAGLVDFDAYRTEQAEWLKKVVASPEYKKAKYRIVMSHFPITELKEYTEGHHGTNDLSEKMLSILNKASVDLVISGHYHKFAFHEPVKGKCNFPILLGSNQSAARLDIGEGKINIRAYDKDNKVLLEKSLKK